MRRLAVLLMLGLASLAATGCGGDSSLPPNPTEDTRDAEIKEADDFMASQAAKSVKAKPARKR